LTKQNQKILNICIKKREKAEKALQKKKEKLFCKKHFGCKNLYSFNFFILKNGAFPQKKKKSLKICLPLILPTECWRKNFLNKIPLII